MPKVKSQIKKISKGAKGASTKPGVVPQKASTKLSGAKSSETTAMETSTAKDIPNLTKDIPTLALKASKALLKWSKDQKTKNPKSELKEAENVEFVWVVLTLRKMSEKCSVKPVGIPLPHSIYPDSDHLDLCLIVKDPQREWKDKIEQENIKSVKKVIGVSKLREKFKPFEAKRQLCASYDLFLADDRVLELLPKLLGKTFFAKKKQPAPVNLKKGNIKGEVDRVMASTFLHHNKGTCCSIKVGHTSMDASAIQENIMECIRGAVDKIPRKWKNVLSIHIKTSESIALPIFAKLPEKEEEEEEEKVKEVEEADSDEVQV